MLIKPHREKDTAHEHYLSISIHIIMIKHIYIRDKGIT